MKPFDEWPELIDYKALAEILRCSTSRACRMMSQPNFPLLLQEDKYRQTTKWRLQKWLRGEPICGR